MAFVPTPNGIKVCMRFNQGGQRVCNIYHIDNGGPPSVTDLTAVAEVFKTWWDDWMKAQTVANVQLDAIEVTDISSPAQEGIEYTTGLPSQGTAVGAALPNNSTIAIKWTTGFTGRSMRGRTYLIGLSQNNLLDPNTMGGASRVAFRNIFMTLKTALDAIGKPLSVLSLVSGGAPRAAGILTHIVDAAINAVLDSQRRRLPERGE